MKDAKYGSGHYGAPSGGRRGGCSSRDAVDSERPRRVYERCSGLDSGPRGSLGDPKKLLAERSKAGKKSLEKPQQWPRGPRPGRNPQRSLSSG